jgi:hypothetical protein
MHYNLLAQHSIQVATEVESMMGKIEPTRLPTREKATGHPIPNPPLRY